MSRKVQAMCYIMVIVLALSLTVVLYVLMPVCENCQSKFCFGRCVIKYDVGNTNQGVANQNSPKTNQNTTRLCETDAGGQNYLDDIVFIGDSRTVALKLYGIKEENIFAEDGLNHDVALYKEVVRLDEKKLTTIKEAVLATLPEMMIINFGINGAAYMPVDTFMEGYTKFVEDMLEASPNSIIVLEAIMPVSLDYEQTTDGCTNEKIDEINEAIFALAEEKGIHYLATNEALKNSYNDLEKGYHNGDGLHYNSDAYEVILSYIKSHAIYRE